MVFRTAGAIAALLIGLGASGGEALAQYYPPPQAYPPQAYPPQAYPPPQGYRPSVADADDNQLYDLQGRPLPPGTVPQATEPAAPAPRYGNASPVYPDEAGLPPPPGTYREPPPAPYGYERPAAGARPSYGSPNPNYVSPPAGADQPDGTRPPLPISPGQIGAGQSDPNATGAVPDSHTMAGLPPEVRPETGPKKQLPLQFRRTLVDYPTKESAGTIIIDTPNTYLYLVLGQGKALRYGIGVGREGFTWAGAEKVSRMAEWPDWTPPEEMIVRQPYLPRFMAGGETNPLGARALYLGKTVYRIHGTNQPSTIGTFVSSGCIRLTNEDVADLYTRVKVGTRVVVMPGKPPATAAATSLAPPAPPAGASAPPAGVSAAPAGPSASPATGPAPLGVGAVTSAPLGPPPSAMAR
jgi:lipoprotein-anchoring transpeptidase ErfK/SrfK